MKNKGIIFGILLFFVVITIGYALLSGNINITSTANVNPLDMDLQLDYGIIPYGDNSILITTTQNGHSDESISCSGMTCSYNVAFNMPGAIQAFYIQITNNSIFDVRMKQINVESRYDGSNYDSSMGMFSIYKNGKDNLISSNRLYTGAASAVEPDSNNLEIDGNEICDNSSCYLKKDGGVYTIAISELVGDSSGSNVLDFSANRTFEFVFEQVN